MVSSLYELLPYCTVKLIPADSQNWGTGVFVATGKIITCAHVVKASEAEKISVIWQGKEWSIAQVVQIYPSPVDLALLQVELPEGEHPPCVLLDEKFEPFDRLYVYGYPDDSPDGGSVTIDCDGTVIDQGTTLIKAKAGQVRPGHSGSPALNAETGKVCGIVSETRGRSTALGGLLIPVSTVFSQFPELQSWNKEIYKQDQRWSSILDPFESAHSDTYYSEFFYSLPEVTPNFKDRHDGIDWIQNFLNSPELRIMFLIGRAGIGKTQMVSRSIKYFLGHESPLRKKSFFKEKMTNIGYLSLANATLTTSGIFNSLSDLLPSGKNDILKSSFRDAKVNIRGKINRLLSEFPSRNTLIILDNFEQVLNLETQEIENKELEAILCTLRDYPNHHPIKVIVISRYPPRHSAILSPEHTILRWLNRGLESPYAEQYLRQQDTNDCLVSYSDEELRQICDRLHGFPRALRALYWTLQVNWLASVEDIFQDAGSLASDDEYGKLIEVLIGEEFNNLSLHEQQVMQILAVLDFPVLPTVIEDLAKQYQLDISTKTILRSLTDKQLVKIIRDKKSQYLSLNSIDSEYALSQIEASATSEFTQTNLRCKAADYFRRKREYICRSLKSLKHEDLIQLIELGLAEFNLRYKVKEYNKATQILIDIGPSLLQLGNYGVIKQHHEHLQNKITDPYLQGLSITELGTAYLYSGQYEQAIRLYSSGLAIARETKNRELEGGCLNNIGNSYYYLGNLDSAIKKYRAALEIAHEAKDKDLEARRLNNLGGCYESLGQIDTAVLYYKQAIAITRETKDLKLEGFLLNNLGICHKDLGMVKSAINYHTQARDIARSTEDIELAGQCYCSLGNCYTLLGDFERATRRYEKALLFTEGIGDWIGKGTTLHSFAEMLIDSAQYHKAIECAKEGLNLGNDINSPKLKVENNCAIARAYLCLQDLPSAYSSAKAAQEYELPEYRYYAQALLGLITLRQGCQQIAHVAFTEALAEIEFVLSKNNRKYEALDIKGMSLLGLTFCGDKDYSHEVKRAYQEARKIINYSGVLRRAFYFLRELEIIANKLKSEKIGGIISNTKAVISNTKKDNDSDTS